ncbi:plexin-A4-like isoform X3 [Apostichopus japonicus]|uniref:plexin-A4-like isoform X3 n=1 Tax=Stichopus japonicus TaxID=307972 RepID=UPI003AB34495
MAFLPVRGQLSLLLVTVLVSLLAPSSSHTYPTFVAEETSTQVSDITQQLYNLVVDPSSGNVIVGALNKIYKLSPDLQQTHMEETGPEVDNQQCPVPPRRCDRERVPTDNINKVLVVDESKLITCGSIYQGTCQVRRLDDLTMLANSTSQEIAPNTVNGTVVAFVTPASMPSSDEKVLFVGTSKGKWQDFDGVPTISSRQLPRNSSDGNLLEIVKNTEGFGTSSKQLFPPEDATNPTGFNIEYVYGFSHRGFSYFIANQPIDEQRISPENYTKIVQICQKDRKYNSYIELPLNCTHNGNKYNLAQGAYVMEISSTEGLQGFVDGEAVLFVTFSKAIPNTMSPSAESAVCMYPVRSIMQKFFDRRISCFSGQTAWTDIRWWEPLSCRASKPLIAQMEAEGPEYCTTIDFIQPIGGVEGYDSEAVYTDSSGLTSITATNHDNDTIIFLGNSNGQLKKLRVMSASQASLYEEKSIDPGSAVTQNGLQFSTDHEFLYVMTQRKIIKVPVAECEQYTDCESCLNVGDGVGDPYCGWCTLQPNCTRRRESQCAGSRSTTSLRWVNSNNRCPLIKQVTPPNTPRTETKNIILDVLNLPRPVEVGSLEYMCVFGDFQPTSAVEVYDPVESVSKVNCSTPSNIGTTEAALTVDLGLFCSNTNSIVASTQFDFFDCQSFLSCTECVQNDFNCNWCIFENSCKRNSEPCDQDGTVYSQMSSDSNVKGREYCPHILEDNLPILIPAGVTIPFIVKAANLPEVEPFSQYECILRYENLNSVVSAQRIDAETLRCNNKMYTYENETQQLEVVLSVTWNENFVIDNPGNTTAILYKCHVQRSSCGQCLVAPSKFECGWCKGTDRCTINSQCLDSTMWLHNNVLCPNPVIDSFFPIAGHVAGDTVVRIVGQNLGRNVTNIKQILVDGVECVVIADSYVPVSEVSCITKLTGNYVGKAHHGKIEITIGDDENDYKGVSSQDFYFVYPKITGVFPKHGPCSGGTLISVTGIDLHAGSNITAAIDDYPCEIESISPEMITCHTSAAPVGRHWFVSLTYDGHWMESVDKFMYMEDPSVVELSRKASIQSGNLTLRVTGSNLAYVNHTAMVFHLNGVPFYGPCTVLSDTVMTCTTPDVSSANLTLPYKVPKEDYGFILDGVQNFTSLADEGNFQPFEFVSDPVYHKFTGVYPIQDASVKYFEVNGTNLTLAYVSGDVTVTIGEEECLNIFLTGDTLRCDAPLKQPNSITGGDLPYVTVHHGSIVMTIGQVQYLEEELPLYIIFIAVAIGVIIIIFFFCLCTVYRRNATKNERKVKHLLQERDRLELQVAMECKEAFAELQISMNHYSRDVGAIPFLGYQQYAIRTLFPDKLDHPVLSELTQLPDEQALQIKTALKEFDQLINNRTFLFLFIQTLEEQPTFMMQDKTSVASLLMVILQSKMDYCTSVIKVLLGKLIEKHVESNRAKLLMRRNESVVEKMVSNWLSFLLYTFLKESAGEPLFTLFYAIKQQVEKGPVDTITGEGRYGLSELKIIRQQIDYQPLSIYAKGLDKNMESIQVKVLNCDTISQVREKILDALYQTTPYIHRPPKEDLDLVLNCGVSGFRTLQDEDSTSEMDSEYKRINTLRHYGIQDGDTLSLEPRQGYNSGVYTSTSGRYATISSTSSPSRVTSPMLSYENENGVKYWHLVKPSEMEEKGKGPGNRMMAEVYLPRLLTMKGTIQNYVDNLFETIFSVNHRGNTLPLAIKYLFDIFDDYAAHHGITDPDVVHSWKSNSLPLRFWVNLIKNPNLILDIHKSDTVDACLSIVGQCLMDACSYSDHPLTRDSPCSKLLYAKDIPNYKDWVNRYYRDIQNLPQVSDQDMNALLTEHSNAHQYDFHSYSALNKLYLGYAQKYRDQILEALYDDEFAQNNNLREKFANLEDLMNNDRMDHQQITEL